MTRILFAVVVIAALSVSASNRAVMVVDLATQHIEGSSNPRVIAAADTLVYFSAHTATAGRELWVTDGTAGGTRRVSDIAAGAASASFGEGRTLGDLLIFSAGLNPLEREVWASDGTAAGTRRLFAANEPIDATEFVAHNGSMYFTARKRNTGHLLFVTDGTMGGTRELPTGHVGWTGRLRVFDGTLYFLAGFTPVLGTNFYRTDGTTIERLGAANGAYDYAIVNGRFVGVADRGLFRRDSSTEALTILRGGPVSDLFVIGSTLYFTARDETVGWELWKSDGTAEGTMLVADVLPGPESSHPSLLAELNGRLLFVTREGDLWSTDGTAKGTSLVRRTRDSMGDIVKLDNRLYFTVQGFVGGYSLWRTDGTAAESIAVVGEKEIVAFRGEVFFTGNFNATGWELYRTDGTAAPRLVADLRGSSASSSPSSLVAAFGHVYFIANNGRGPALWRSNGTAGGTSLVTRSVTTPTPIAQCGAYLYFGSQSLASLDAAGQVRPLTAARISASTACARNTFFFIGAQSRLHASDGRAISELSDVAADEVAAIGDRVIFISASDNSIHASDGTAAGTRPLMKFNPPGVKSGSLTGAGTQAFFVAANQLWVTDGTTDGTRALRAMEIAPVAYAALGRQLFYLHIGELWRSDGTAEGTVKVPGTPARLGSALAATGDAVFFTEELADGRRGVWRTNGTAAGTYSIDASYAVATGAMFALGDVLFVRDRNLISTFGARTTKIVLPEDPSMTAFARAGDYLFFPADDGVFGEELWMADLTPRRRSARH